MMTPQVSILDGGELATGEEVGEAGGEEGGSRGSREGAGGAGKEHGGGGIIVLTALFDQNSNGFSYLLPFAFFKVRMCSNKCQA